ncbi:hypothetical protein [Flavisolibacter ginsenosidimutans]|uniref:Uncharacterized protein n=1 Tax=Flavisolibacter ginsenosidimutans TaxID=661481 RepID=A0A5B8UHS4_9BACT|nr:hypothetical protein [Flavisolibacter ginsenosidimutans]QEC56058.1 hypothetical protein FSB75_09180 [Flavisolibacter ginsenosidimutans]
MNKVLTFETLDTICQLNIDKDYVADCLKIMREEKCFFFDGVVLPQEHTASLYRLRLEIKKDNKNPNHQLITDWEKAVVNIENSKSRNIGLTSIIGEVDNFLIFYEPFTRKILGVSKTKSSDVFQNLEKKFKEKDIYGLGGFELYNKAIPTKE